MSRGKPQPIGPTARLRGGKTWDLLAAMTPEAIRGAALFPYPALPHVKQGGGYGGQVFPQMQIEMFPRLQRFDVDFDLPEAFLPEFPPRRDRFDQQLLPPLQGHPDAGAARRTEAASHALCARGVQPHR
jgi:hypothetical protein